MNTTALPHSEESERAVLAAVMLSPNLLGVVRSIVCSDDFYLDRHRYIFDAYGSISERSETPDMRTVQAELERRGRWEDVGSMAYLAGLDLDLPDLSRVTTYAQIVKDRSVSRKLLELAKQIEIDVYSGELDVTDTAARASQQLRELSANTTGADMEPSEIWLGRALAEMEARSDSHNDWSVRSGFRALDKWGNGLGRGWMCVIAGRPGMGKTTLALNVIRNVALNGHNVGVISLEMTSSELAIRLLANDGFLPFENLRNGTMSASQWQQVYESAQRLSDQNIYLDATLNASPDRMKSQLKKLAERIGGIDLWVLDYMQLATMPGYGNNRVGEVTAMSRACKQICMELEAPGLILSQLSRRCEQREDRRPILSDLRESGGIEQDADVVFFVYRGEIYNAEDPDIKGLAEIIVSKHRHGPTGTSYLHWDGTRSTFRDLPDVVEGGLNWN